MKIDFENLEFYGIKSGWWLDVGRSTSGSIGQSKYWDYPVYAVKKSDVRTKNYSYAKRYEVITFMIRVPMPASIGPFEPTPEEAQLNALGNAYGAGYTAMWKRLDAHKPDYLKVHYYLRRMAESSVFEPKHFYGEELDYDAVMAVNIKEY